MCGLCGVLGADDHWTEPSGRPGVFAAAAATRRQDRYRRIALANRVLDHCGLGLTDFQGRSYVVRTKTGQAALVDHLGGLWPVAERLAKRPLDPLDPALIERLERG